MAIKTIVMVVIVWLNLLCSDLLCQISLKGVVTDNGAEPVRNAVVELIDQENSSRKFSAKTNMQGQYVIDISQTGVNDITSQRPAFVKIFQNYPNPFNPSTIIAYELESPSHVRIEVYNLLGQKVKSLFNGFQAKHEGQVRWDGTDDFGQGVSGGTYLYTLETEGQKISNKMLMLDGHLQQTDPGTAPILNKTDNSRASLLKQLSNQYTLRVTGKNLQLYERLNFQLTGSIIYNVKVNRIACDIDGNVYKTVKIGNQWWLAENLKTTRYLNGDIIPNIKDYLAWSGITTGAYCSYDNDISYVNVYGRLYDWFAASDNRKIAPVGWLIPTDAEWQTLIDNLGGSGAAGGRMKEAGLVHWVSPNTGGTNDCGFTAMPAGYRANGVDKFNYLGYSAEFWSTKESGSMYALTRYLEFGRSRIDQRTTNKNMGISIRCIKEVGTSGNTSPYASFTVKPSFGNPLTAFSCDASGSSDYEDETSDLEVRWDWENDGRWDTAYSPDKKIIHTFSKEGLNTIKVEIKDSEGLTHTATVQVSVSAGSREDETVIDIDGNKYRTVKIGSQWWMAENLKVTHYRNGDLIPNITDYVAWASMTSGACCDYNNDSKQAAIYGKLYNWYAANDSRKIAPLGWHIPTDSEWQKLIDCLGSSEAAGCRMKETGTAHWVNPNTDATNDCGFSALPAGYRPVGVSKYNYLGYSAEFWSSTTYSSNFAWTRYLEFGRSRVDHGKTEMKQGISIRCVRD